MPSYSQICLLIKLYLVYATELGILKSPISSLDITKFLTHTTIFPF